MAFPHDPTIGQIGEPPPREPARAEDAADDSAGDDANEVDWRSRAEAAEARERQTHDLLRQQLAARPSASPAAPRPEDPIDPGDPPDPATDPDGFKAWQRAAREYDRFSSRRELEQTRDAALAAARSDAIMEQYLSMHPAYRNLQPTVLEAFRKAVVEMGLNELPQDPTALYARVDQQMEAIVTGLNPKPKPRAEENGDPRDGEEPNRARGLSGGSNRSRAATPSAGARDEEGKVKTLREVMLERQEKMGLF